MRHSGCALPAVPRHAQPIPMGGGLASRQMMQAIAIPTNGLKIHPKVHPKIRNIQPLNIVHPKIQVRNIQPLNIRNSIYKSGSTRRHFFVSSTSPKKLLGTPSGVFSPCSPSIIVSCLSVCHALLASWAFARRKLIVNLSRIPAILVGILRSAQNEASPWTT